MIISEKKDGDMRNEDNIRSFCKKIGIKRNLLVLGKQIHGSTLKKVRGKDGGKIFQGTDGFFTFSSQIFLGVRVADCLPISFFSKNVCGIVHAGWRGIAGGVIEKIFQKNDIEKEKEVFFEIGPGIGVCHFEVREDFFTFFKEKNLGEFVEKRNGSCFFDLKGFVEKKIKKYDNVKKVQSFPVCTFCDDNYFSFRRDGTPRALVAIVGRKFIKK